MQRALLLDKVKHPIIYVQNVLAAVEDEKDPRNLVMSFDLIYFIITEYFQEGSIALGEDSQELKEQLHESLFDAVSCYYPINFKPPKNDTYKITPEQLKHGLAKCMLASSQLGHLFIPFLLEKLGAAQRATKLETLELLTQIVERFSFVKMKNELSQILSHVSNMYFNVIEDQVQEAASVTIGKTLAALMDTTGSGMASDQTGIVFMNGAAENEEINEFINRCVQDIQSSPESMQAGLSSVLLKQISVTTSRLQVKVTKDVYLNIVEKLCQGEEPIVNQVAYLTVVIGLTQAVANSNLHKPLCAETLENGNVCKMLQDLILANTSPLRQGLDQMFFNKLTNTLALYGSLLDLKAKSKVNTDFGSREFQVEILNRVANNLVKEITASTVESPMSKMSFATLAKEVNRDSALVEEILLQCY